MHKVPKEIGELSVDGLTDKILLENIFTCTYNYICITSVHSPVIILYIYNMFKNIYFIRSFLSIMFIQTIYILINYMTFNNLFTLTKCIIYWKVVNISRKENIYP